jgi:hypothetical protein
MKEPRLHTETGSREKERPARHLTRACAGPGRLGRPERALKDISSRESEPKGGRELAQHQPTFVFPQAASVWPGEVGPGILGSMTTVPSGAPPR